jgi:NitT/TauT family transport system permease protein
MLELARSQDEEVGDGTTSVIILAGELLFISGGLGQVLELGRELHDMALVLGVMVVIVALGLVSDHLLFGQLEARVRRSWGLDRA